MKNLKSILAIVGCAAALLFSTAKTQAQRPNFDPAQFRQMRIDRLKEQLSVTNDDEWKVLEGAIGKVIDSQMEVMSSLRGMGGGGGRMNRGNNNGNTNDNNGGNGQARRQRGGGGGGGGMFGTPSPEMEDLQKAIEDKAPADEIKSKLSKVRESTAAKEAKLESAQEELKKLLTSRQEAVAVLNGILK